MIHISLTILVQIHIKEVNDSEWFLWKQVSVQYLSPEPILEGSFLLGLSGSFSIRVFAVNLAGVGEYSETSVLLSGLILLFFNFCSHVSDFRQHQILSQGGN